MTLRIIPLGRDDANDFVRRLHRHSRPVAGYKFAIGAELVVDGQAGLVGVVIVGRPIAQKLDDGMTAEITRLCTDGTRNACSFLYGAARRAVHALGYAKVITYTLPEEGGASLRAAGFKLVKDDAGGSAIWHGRPRPQGTEDLVGGRWRWAA